MTSRKPDHRDHLLGIELVRLRRSVHLTQCEMADQLGITPQQLAKYEQGKNRISHIRFVEVTEIIAGRSAGRQIPTTGFSEQDQASYAASVPAKAQLSIKIEEMQHLLNGCRELVERL